MSAGWKRCSTCKKDISFGQLYYECSVSTCTRKRTGYVFCSVDCWEVHLPLARHREAWAVEETAPTAAQWAAQGESAKSPGGAASPSMSVSRSSAPAVRRREPEPAAAADGAGGATRRVVTTKAPPPPKVPREVLVIASRLKDYVREVHQFNTSDGVLEPLSGELRRLADKAVENARSEGRKTLLDRDFDFLRRR